MRDPAVRELCSRLQEQAEAKEQRQRAVARAASLPTLNRFFGVLLALC